MIDTQEALDQLVAVLAEESRIAVDCEMDSMYAYATKICLVQLGWSGGEALVDGLVDLDRSGLGHLFADPAVVKVFHGGENDVGLMRDRWGLEFANVFDTMLASQILGHDGVGLAAVLERHFGVTVSKKFQKADWRVRPLPESQAEYARLDVRYLLPLRDRLLSELERLGRVEEADCDFERMAQVRIEARPFDPEGWTRVKGWRDLPANRRGIVAAVYVARDTIASRLDRAPYRVMHDSAIVELARRRPETEAALRRIRGIDRKLSSRHVATLLEAVADGRSKGAIPVPRPRRGRRRPWEPPAALTPEQEAAFEALRAWRARRARQRGVEVSRVATTALLLEVARAHPADLEELAGVDGMEAWRVREYGDDVLAVLHGTRT